MNNNEECVEISEAYLRHYCDKEDLSEVTNLELELDSAEQRVEALGDFLPNLESLKLNNSVIYGVRDLGAKFTNVKFLWLNRCQLLELDGIASLLPSLEELYVAFNEISELAPLQFHETLSVLDCDGNQIRDFTEIENLASCYMLTELTVEDNPILKNYKTKSAFTTQIRQALPQLQILNSETISGAIDLDDIYELEAEARAETNGIECSESFEETLGEEAILPPYLSSDERLARIDDERMGEEHPDCFLKEDAERNTQHLLEKLRDLERKEEGKVGLASGATPMKDGMTTAKNSTPGWAVCDVDDATPGWTPGSAAIGSPLRAIDENSPASKKLSDAKAFEEEPGEHDLILEAVKATRQNYWKSRAQVEIASGRRPATSYSAGGVYPGYRPVTSYSNFMSKLERPLTCSTASWGGDDNDRASTAVSSSSVSSELTQGDDTLCGANPLKAIRQRRKNLNLSDKHSDNISEMLAKFRSQCNLTEEEIARRRKQLQENGMRPKTADVRISGGSAMGDAPGGARSSVTRNTSSKTSSIPASVSFNATNSCSSTNSLNNVNNALNKLGSNNGSGVNVGLTNSGKIPQISDRLSDHHRLSDRLSAMEIGLDSLSSDANKPDGACNSSECTTANDENFELSSCSSVDQMMGTLSGTTLSTGSRTRELNPLNQGMVNPLNQGALDPATSTIPFKSNKVSLRQLEVEPSLNSKSLGSKLSIGTNLNGFSPPKPLGQSPQKLGVAPPLRKYSKRGGPSGSGFFTEDGELNSNPTRITKRGEVLVLS